MPINSAIIDDTGNEMDWSEINQQYQQMKQLKQLVQNSNNMFPPYNPNSPLVSGPLNGPQRTPSVQPIPPPMVWDAVTLNDVLERLRRLEQIISTFLLASGITIFDKKDEVKKDGDSAVG